MFYQPSFQQESSDTSSVIKRQSIVPPAFQVFHDTFHFSPAIRVGDAMWVSGQVGLDAEMKPAEGMRAQARLAFEALKAVLGAAGASLADVVELTTFHTQLQRDLQEFIAVKDEYIAPSYPAWTAVGVTELALPGLCIEIRAVAVVGCSLVPFGSTHGCKA